LIDKKKVVSEIMAESKCDSSNETTSHSPRRKKGRTVLDGMTRGVVLEDAGCDNVYIYSNIIGNDGNTTGNNIMNKSNDSIIDNHHYESRNENSKKDDNTSSPIYNTTTTITSPRFVNNNSSNKCNIQPPNNNVAEFSWTPSLPPLPSLSPTPPSPPPTMMSLTKDVSPIHLITIKDITNKSKTTDLQIIPLSQQQQQQQQQQQLLQQQPQQQNQLENNNEIDNDDEETIIDLNPLVSAGTSPAEKLAALIRTSERLDFNLRPRPRRDGSGRCIETFPNVVRPTETMRWHILALAIDHGYGPSVTVRERSVVASAACRIVGYDHGLPLPQGARALKGWYKGYELSKYGGEPHPLRGRYNNCGRKNYVRNIEESHPGYLHGLFTEAVGQYGESASWQKLAEVMNELAKSCGPEIHGSCEELRDLKMTRHRLRELFCANRTKGSAPVKKGELCRGIIQQRQMEENDNDDSDGLCGKYDQS